MKFLGGVGHGPRNDAFNFGDDPDHRPPPGVRSQKSAFTVLSKKFMESWGVAQRPTDYVLVTIRITIWIRESVPDHDPDPGRTATLSTHTEQMPSWILAQRPSDYIFLTIWITVRIQESEVRNTDLLDSGVRPGSAHSGHV